MPDISLTKKALTFKANKDDKCPICKGYFLFQKEHIKDCKKNFKKFKKELQGAEKE